MSSFNMRSLIERLGLKHPIFQAPMAGISSIEMAAAVTNNGALGAIPFGAAKIDSLSAIEKSLTHFKSLTNSSKVNLNFFCHDIETSTSDVQFANWKKLYSNYPNYNLSSIQNGNISFKEFELHNNFEPLLKLLEEFQPAVISFHFGIPSTKVLHRLQSSGILLFATATSIAEVKHLVNLGFDGVVLQGYEAGGHRGNFLVPEVLDENLSTAALFAQTMALKPNCYVVPAGGIVNGKMIQDLVSNGASACQLGTAFIATQESYANDTFKQKLSDKALTSIMTPLISGKPARCLKTTFIEDIVQTYSKDPTDLPPYGWRYYAYKTWNASNKNPELGFYLVGQNYSLVNHQPTTKQVIESLVQQFQYK